MACQGRLMVLALDRRRSESVGGTLSDASEEEREDDRDCEEVEEAEEEDVEEAEDDAIIWSMGCYELRSWML